MLLINLSNFGITIEFLLAFMGAITILATGIRTIMNFLNPIKKIKERLSIEEGRLDLIDRRLQEGDIEFKFLRSASRIQSEALLAIMDSLITGNSVDNIKVVREKLRNFIIHNG